MGSLLARRFRTWYPPVFGVVQDVAYRGAAPRAGSACRVGWDRRWVAVGVGVEAFGDGAVAEFLVDAPAVDLLDDRCPVGVESQPGLGSALGAAGGYGVRDFLGQVAVGGLTDVEACLGVLFEPTA